MIVQFGTIVIIFSIMLFFIYISLLKVKNNENKFSNQFIILNFAYNLNNLYTMSEYGHRLNSHLIQVLLSSINTHVGTQCRA